MSPCMQAKAEVAATAVQSCALQSVKLRDWYALGTAAHSLRKVICGQHCCTDQRDGGAIAHAWG